MRRPTTTRPTRLTSRPSSSTQKVEGLTDTAARDLLDDEAAAFRPFEALGQLDDTALDVPVPAAHDWSGRDLIAHLVGWLSDAIDVATELKAQPVSPARERSRRAFAARGDDINADIQVAWRALPLAEVRRRLADVPVALRDLVRGVPSSSWEADPDNLDFIRVYTIEHYADHSADLEAILDAARR